MFCLCFPLLPGNQPVARIGHRNMNHNCMAYVYCYIIIHLFNTEFTIRDSSSCGIGGRCTRSFSRQVRDKIGATGKRSATLVLDLTKNITFSPPRRRLHDRPFWQKTTVNFQYIYHIALGGLSKNP